ncbi:hypothetical protein V8C42DRAFT_330883 [Trichoderma barbatum]
MALIRAAIIITATLITASYSEALPDRLLNHTITRPKRQYVRSFMLSKPPQAEKKKGKNTTFHDPPNFPSRAQGISRVAANSFRNRYRSNL